MSSSTICISVRKGSAFPEAVAGLVDEEVLEELKAECRSAETEEDMKNIIARYNNQHRWNGAITGRVEEKSVVETAVGMIYSL